MHPDHNIIMGECTKMYLGKLWMCSLKPNSLLLSLPDIPSFLPTLFWQILSIIPPSKHPKSTRFKPCSVQMIFCSQNERGHWATMRKSVITGHNSDDFNTHDQASLPAGPTDLPANNQSEDQMTDPMPSHFLEDFMQKKPKVS